MLLILLISKKLHYYLIPLKGRIIHGKIEFRKNHKYKFSSFFQIIEPTSNWLNTWNTLMAILLLLYFYLLIINLYFTEHDED
jgi:hypothetical protein